MSYLLIRRECNLVFIALSFLTRIPVPKSVDFSQHFLNEAARYFSLIGWLVGIVCAASYFIASNIFPVNIAIVISMLICVLLTGCFHEDGLADTCDGLGGGWKQQQKLEIMKDSRLGTYGAVAIWFTLTLKYSLLVQVDSIVIALLVAHPLSRSFSSALIYFLPYVSQDKKSKVKPLAERLSIKNLVINLLIGIAALSLATTVIVPILFLFVLVFGFLCWCFHRQIKGFTGDTLGAAQQIFELLVYAVLLVNGSTL